VCGAEGLPIEAMAAIHKAGRTYATACRGCSRRRKREATHRLADAARGDSGELVEQPVESDPTPAVVLRSLLAQHRARGFSFGEVFAEDVDRAVRCVDDPHEREQWEFVLLGTRRAWLAGWNREPGPGRLTGALIEEPGEPRPGWVLVA
jgi:hypothetical protein